VTVIVFNNDGMGHADAELRHKLAASYLELLAEDAEPPSAICFYGSGVKLAAEGSPVLKQLAALEAKGVPLIICGTCTQHYGLLEQIRVGKVGGMPDIYAAQHNADKVITL